MKVEEQVQVGRVWKGKTPATGRRWERWLGDGDGRGGGGAKMGENWRVVC